MPKPNHSRRAFGFSGASTDYIRCVSKPGATVAADRVCGRLRAASRPDDRQVAPIRAESGGGVALGARRRVIHFICRDKRRDVPNPGDLGGEDCARRHSGQLRTPWGRDPALVPKNRSRRSGVEAVLDRDPSDGGIAQALGKRVAATATPAMRSPRNQRRSYRRIHPIIGTCRHRSAGATPSPVRAISAGPSIPELPDLSGALRSARSLFVRNGMRFVCRSRRLWRLEHCATRQT